MIKKATAFIVVGVFVALVVYDIYAYFFGGEGATISRVYLSWAMDRPWLIFGSGYLMGHLTWPQKVRE